MPHLHASRAALGLAIVLSAAPAVSGAQAPEERKAATPAETSDGLASLMRQGAGPQTPITVMMSPAVQRELKLTDAQKSKVFNLALTSGQKQRDLIQSMVLTGANDPRSMMAARHELRRENELAVGQILDAKQKERFEQIVLQAEGPLAVARPEIAEKLRLNQTQNEYVQTIMVQMQQSQRMLYMAARRQAITFQQLDPGQFAQVRARMSQVRDEAVKQLSKILDRKQKANFNKLLGEPFDLSKLDPESAGASPEAKSPADPSAAKDEGKAEAKDKDAPPSEKGEAKPAGRSSRRKSRTKSAPK